MGSVHTSTELRRAAVDYAQLGAAEALRWFGNVSVTRKADNTPVTAADHASQEAILYHIARRFPGHAVLVEEEVARPQRHGGEAGAEYCWMVDPLDGTRNFARGVRIFAVSVAVLQQGRPVAGAIYDSTSGAVYSASSDEGAFLNERPLRLADRPIDADTTIAISSFRKRPVPSAVRGWLDQYLFRNHGAVALHLAWVAAGVVDAAYALECKPWDIAAGALLIEKAGGAVTNHQGATLWPFPWENYSGQDVPILAGRPHLHQRLIESLIHPGT